MPNESTTPSTPATTRPGFVRWVLRVLAPYRGACLAVVVALSVQTAFRVLVPVGYQKIFDGAIAEQDERLLFTILLWLMVGWVLHGLAGWVQDYQTAWVSSRAMNSLREQMFRQLQRLPESFYTRVDSGDLMSRFSNDLAVVEQALARGVTIALFSSLILSGSLVLLFVVEWRLATLTLLALFVALALPRVLGRRAHDRAYARKAAEAEVSAAVQESIGAHATVRAFDLRDHTLAHFRERLGDLADAVVSSIFSAALVGRVASQSVFFVQILIMGLGGWLAIEGALSVGALVGFVALLLNVSNACNHLAAVTPELLQASGGVRRVQEFLDEELAAPEAVDAKPLPRLSGDVTFGAVSFAYDEADPILDRLSFTVQAGESVALVGTSGSGKSTILNLLLRLYHPTGGAVRFDGVDVRQATESSLRDQIGVVLQETVLLKTSFAENIRLGKLDASDEEVVAAARLAKIHDVILAKPQGYDTPVGEAGRHLSVGQRQRIAIARAILRDPALLVLDEATSALDPTTEAAIHETLKEVAKGRTVISATHRLASVVDVDRILVLERGHIVEEGRHKELLARRGAYHRLWRKQSGFEVSSDGSRAQVSPDRLRQVPLLSGVDDETLVLVAQRFSSQLHPQNRFVFRQGDLGEAFYIVVKGHVEVLVSADDREQRVATLDDGDFFGELALLDAKPRNASVRTLSPSLFLVLQREQFERLLDDQPGLRSAIEATAEARRPAG